MKKKICSFFVMFVLFCSFVALMSCSPVSSSGSSVSKKAKYTVMLYAAGGGDLDDSLINVLDQIKYYQEIEGLDSNLLNVTAQFNMSDIDTRVSKTDASGNNVFVSTEYQEPGSEYKGTMRWYMTENGWNKENNLSQVQILHDPDVLTDFINYSKAKFPADKYILILKDHGYCFDIREQPVDSSVTRTNARGVIYDTNRGNTNRPLSIFGIEEGIKNSSTKMELVYFDCCLMGQIEMLYQLRNQTNYILSSSNPGWSLVNYGNFFDCLKEYSSVPEAMDKYLLGAVEYWQTGTKAENITASCGIDMVLTDMSKMEKFADEFKKVKNVFIEENYSVPLTEEKKSLLAKMYKPSIKQLVAAQKFATEETVPDDWKNGKLYYFDFFIVQTPVGARIHNFDYTSVDIDSTFTLLAADSAKLLMNVNKMKKVLDELIISAVCAFEPDFIAKTSLGLVFIDKQRFERDYFSENKGLGTSEYPTIKSCYQKLAWDEKTLWSEFFEKNIAPE